MLVSILTLNSIMFLLIQQVHWCCSDRVSPLNSIMFLLIQMQCKALRIKWTPLNSIMFLLILLQPFLQPHFLNSLNSIMFLLIPQPFRDRAHNVYPFKFHYVSINSKKSVVTRAGNSPLNSIMFLLILIFSFVNASRWWL